MTGREDLKEMGKMFCEELHLLMKKHEVNSIICCNHDDGVMGYLQLTKILKDEGEGYVFVIAFSGSGDVLCPNCKKNSGPGGCGHVTPLT